MKRKKGEGKIYSKIFYKSDINNSLRKEKK